MGSISALKACAFSGKYLKMIGNAHERWAIMRGKTFSLLFFFFGVCVCSCTWRYFHIWTKTLVFTCCRMLFKQYNPRDFMLGEEPLETHIPSFFPVCKMALSSVPQSFPFLKPSLKHCDTMFTPEPDLRDKNEKLKFLVQKRWEMS